MNKIIAGEFIGTFILVFIGCGAVGADVVHSALNNLFLMGLVWAVGVALAIFASRKLSGAHLNPAVSLWLYFKKDISFFQLIVYVITQFFGAFLAATVLYVLFKNALAHIEPIPSLATAKMFGEYYSSSTLVAFAMEFLGTVFLLSGIAVVVNRVGNKQHQPILIGLVVGVAIVIVAPYTQCGINPARDLAPRILSGLAGWGKQVFVQHFLLVYVVAPLFASWVYFKLSEQKPR